MATYWKSQPKKFCDFCKCWITDNKPSIDFHEKGKKHKENVQRRIDEVRKKSGELSQAKAEYEDDMKQVEMAALKAFQKDLEDNPEMAAQYKAKIEAAKEREEEKRRQEEEERNKILEEKKRKEEERKKKEEEAKIHWFEAKSPEGYSYYWHTQTNEAVWVAPEKYVPLEEQERIEEEEKLRKEEEEWEKEEERKRKELAEIVPASNIDAEELLQSNFGPQPRQATKRVYGNWVTVSDNTMPEPEPESQEPIPVECIPLPGQEDNKQEKEEESVKPEELPKPKSRFKEKKVTSLGKAGENVEFKKRKIASGARNIRRREDD